MSELVVNDTLTIPLSDIELKAVRSQGAGGQNVNKLATAIHLSFDFRRCAAIDAELRERLSQLDDRRVTAQGIVIKAQEYRTQRRNRDAVLRRLRALIASALIEPNERKPTRIPRAARERRLEVKRQRSKQKSLRGPIRHD